MRLTLLFACLVFVGLRHSVTAAECQQYDHRQLAISQAGPGEWTLTAGSTFLQALGSEQDAQRACALASAHSTRCSIAWDIAADGRIQGIQYWQGQRDSAPTTHEDCIRYQPNDLRVIPIDGGRWQLRSGLKLLAFFPDHQRAEEALVFAKERHFICFIGRNSRGPRRASHIMQYWK